MSIKILLNENEINETVWNVKEKFKTKTQIHKVLINKNLHTVQHVEYNHKMICAKP